MVWKPKKQPDNILVDYDFDGTEVTNFRCCLADWGTSYQHFGGTPMYAGPRTYEADNIDFFSFARLALELFLRHEGKWTTFLRVLIQFWTFCWLYKEWLFLAFFPQEDAERLTLLRRNLSPFLKTMSKALSYELENGDDEIQQLQIEALYNEILRNLPAESSTSNYFAGLSQASDTLQLEFVKLLDLE